jgi:DNA-binding NarL/FixJ family response regulator
MIKLIIIEDDVLISNTMKSYLEPEFSVLNTFESIENFTNNNNNTDEPDLVILDVVLPGINGVDGIPIIRQIYPNTNIVIFTVMEDNDNIYKALTYGAVGYMSKDHSLSEVSEILKTIHNGGSFMSPVISRKILSFFSPKNNNMDGLTSREQEIAESILDGLSYKMIAEKHAISIDTVRKHIKNIYKKLHINSKGELFKLHSK